MPHPKVSVCVDVYNYADFLPDALDSVLAQTFSDFELIVVDDCSTDDSYAVACKYARRDDRIHAYRNPVNLGMVKNRNACLRQARGEYVKFLHADDFLRSPDALSKMVERIEANPAASMVACAMQFVREDNTSQGRSPRYFPDTRFIAGTTVITRCLCEQKNLIGGPSSVLFRRSRGERGFDEDYFHAADLEMWLHLLEQGCFGYIDEPLIAYRWHPRQQTEKDRGSLSQANDQRAMLASYLDKPYVRLRPWLKEYLRHDAVRQTLRRCRKIGLADTAHEVIREYGARHYYANLPWCTLWRKGKRFAGHVYEQAAPFPIGATGSDAGRPTRRVPAVHEQGINVAGFLQGQYGIGESSRAFCRAVTETGLPYALINIESRDHSNRDASVQQFSRHNPYGVNLMTFSFDYARRFYRDRGPGFFEGRRNIGLWYWELHDFPARWHSQFGYYDEIWVPSAFCQRALAAVSPIPVRHVTYPLYTDTVPAADRAAFSIPKSSYVFLFNFDFYSTLARKNPLALIAAFRQAFAPGGDVTLVLKSINSQHDPPGRQQIQQAISGLNVVWIESNLSGAQMQSLFASCDCYVSLHRSEGLGLGMAQAMALGKLVIATGYSGNLEYMREGNSLLVKYDLVEIRQHCGPHAKPPAYPKGLLWAEPDAADAANKMRWAYENREAGARIGERAREEIKSILNPEKTRAEIRDRMPVMRPW